jgi:hypothetical protein
MRNSDPTEKLAGGAAECLGGDVYVYRSSEGDRWTRLCMVVHHPQGGGSRADVLLSPEQAAMVAGAMERNDPEFLCVAKGMLWWRRHTVPPLGSAVLGAECAYGNGSKEVCVSSGNLHQIAAALRAASSPPAGGADPLGGARRRTDDNLRRAFGRSAERQ